MRHALKHQFRKAKRIPPKLRICIGVGGLSGQWKLLE